MPKKRGVFHFIQRGIATGFRISWALVCILLGKGIETRAESYQVEPHDMLGLISLKLYGKADYAGEISGFNHLETGCRLHPGQILKLPPRLEKQRIPRSKGDLAELRMWRRHFGTDTEVQDRAHTLFGDPKGDEGPRRIKADHRAMIDLVRAHPSYCSIEFIRRALLKSVGKKGGSPCADYQAP